MESGYFIWTLRLLDGIEVNIKEVLVMGIRKPVVAGQFYPADRKGCIAELNECLMEGPFEGRLPERIVAGIVPHAGWTFSGNLAGRVFQAIKKVDGDVDTFVIFGGAHRYIGRDAAIYDRGAWLSPLGEIAIDEDLADAIALIDHVSRVEDCHRDEHSIEVQVPFIQKLFGDSRIVPVMIGPVSAAVDIGREVGHIVAELTDRKVVCIASTDLTHYGPQYGFCSHGSGEAGIKWAKEINDMEFIDLALKMESGLVLEAAEENMSACGPGAAAAVIAAAKAMGKNEGILLGHTHSDEVMREKYGRHSEESVGYAAIVY